MITGYLKPTSGTVEFLERDITGIEPRDATHLGLCRSFQISQVFMTMSVKQNLMIAMSLSKKSGKALLDPIDDEKISKECDDILELYKIKNQSENIVSTLSQGIRKLLDIAMAVVGNPKVILLDEPTSGVSVEEKFGIMDIVIAALKQSETSVLFVEHDMEIVERYVDRVIAFYQGEIICDAPPKEALSNKKVIEYVLGH
jgi:branched-chain amino acid transport system ATP-binding protein